MDYAKRIARLEQTVAEVRDDVDALADAVGGAVAATLDAVEFASDEAAEIALDAGLGAVDFANADPSGKTGYTAADVRELAEAAEGDDGGDS